MVTLLVWCGWMVFCAISTATMDIQKQAKAAGVDAKNCQYCHVDKLPKKDAGMHELERCRQVAHRREGEAGRQGRRRRVGEGLSEEVSPVSGSKEA